MQKKNQHQINISPPLPNSTGYFFYGTKSCDPIPAQSESHTQSQSLNNTPYKLDGTKAEDVNITNSIFTTTKPTTNSTITPHDKYYHSNDYNIIREEDEYKEHIDDEEDVVVLQLGDISSVGSIPKPNTATNSHNGIDVQNIIRNIQPNQLTTSQSLPQQPIYNNNNYKI